MKKVMIVAVAAIMLTACGHKAQNKHFEKTIRVHAIEMGSADGTQCRTYVGQVASDMSINMSFPLGGKLTELHVSNGQHVRKGQLIARVDDTSAKSLHDAQMATLRQAEDGYARLKQVYEGGGVSEVRWVQMETDLEKARQAELSARKHLEDCSLYAPQDGVISMSEHTIGEQLDPLSPLCKLLDLNSMHINFDVPEKEVFLIEKGEEATATMPSFPGKVLKVKVTDKGLLANPMGHTYEMKAQIKDAAGIELLPGQVAKVQLHSTSPDGLIVPSWCVQTMADGLVVWTARDGKAYRTPITAKTYVKNGVMIESGLEPGDIVITDGYQKLYTGADVEIIEEEE